MPDGEHRMLRTAAARADFLESGRSGAAGVPDLVAASWERSHAAGVNAEHPQSEYQQVDTSSLLLRCARPVLQQLGDDTADIPLVIALTDPRARVVVRIDNSTAVGRLLDRVEFCPGFSYAETEMGTNGVGTVLEAGQPVSIVGPEHFAENLHAFACAGAPIIDPMTGRVEGVLDITSLTPTWSPLMHSLVKSAAKDITRNLLSDRSQVQQAVFTSYMRVSAKAARQAVFAFGERDYMANATAQTAFDPVDLQTLRDHATFMMRHRDRAIETLALPGGRVVRVRGSRIVVGAEVVGLVVVVDSPRAGAPSGLEDQLLQPVAVATRATARLADELARPRPPIAAGASPAWTRAGQELRGALVDRLPALVMGETGAGKFTLVTELFHGSHAGARSVSVDAAQLGVDDRNGLPPGDPDQLAAEVDSLLDNEPADTLYIVRNIDQASTEAVEELDRFFGALVERENSSWFVATLSDSSLDSELPFTSLLSYFELTVTVPPLRCRTEDQRAVTAALLREIAPNRKVRLSPDAERLIARYSWPRNVSQLREALQHALRRRPVGELQEDDLPAYCHTGDRARLTPLETAERDAIIDALQAHDGNRVAAAAHLGMARSSLYRKLRHYRITM